MKNTEETTSLTIYGYNSSMISFTTGFIIFSLNKFIFFFFFLSLYLLSMKLYIISERFIFTILYINYDKITYRNHLKLNLINYNIQYY